MPTGSMADVPKDLLQEIKKLEEQFTVDSVTLKKITDHFVSELTKGRCHARPDLSHISLLTFSKA